MIFCNFVIITYCKIPMMNKIVLFLTITFFYFGTNRAFAQNPFDCVSAMDVCDSSSLHLQFDSVVGAVPVVLDTPNCVESYYSGLYQNTVWLKYHFVTSGDFIFDLTPDSMYVDLDFYVFKSSTGDCSQLSSIRCMTSGPSIPDTMCLGSTGLAYGSTDTVETPGCGGGSDNYLAPVQIEAGDVLYLAILNFSDQFFVFRVKHGGTAMISCEPVATSMAALSPSLRLSPNPVKDLLHIDFDESRWKNAKVELVDLYGKTLLTPSSVQDLDVSAFPKGIYFVRVWDGEQLVGIEKVVKY